MKQAARHIDALPSPSATSTVRVWFDRLASGCRTWRPPISRGVGGPDRPRALAQHHLVTREQLSVARDEPAAEDAATGALRRVHGNGSVEHADARISS
jgi:hypothetical protein